MKVPELLSADHYPAKVTKCLQIVIHLTDIMGRIPLKDFSYQRNYLFCLSLPSFVVSICFEITIHIHGHDVHRDDLHSNPSSCPGSGIIGDIELKKRKQIFDTMILSNSSIRYNPDI